MSRSAWVGVLLTVLLAQSMLPVAASCLAGRTASMPCCKPGSDCAAAGVNVPSCCGMDAPADRRQDADRQRGETSPSSDRQAVAPPHTQASPAADRLAACCDLTGSPPRDTGTPIYLRLGTLLI